MADFPLPLIGKKTSLRRLSEKDLAAWYALETDAEVKRYVGGSERSPQAEWMEKARNALPTISTLGVMETASGRFAGRASLTQYNTDPHHWEVAVVIAKFYWRKSLGREVSKLLIDAAFRYLNASTVFAIIHPENKASRTLVDKLGFQLVGENQSSWPEWQKGHLIFQLHAVG